MGSFPSDLTLKVNIDPASAIAKFKQIEDHIKKGTQGIAGEYEKAAKIGESMAKQMIDVSSRAGRQLESQLRSIEKQTQSLGKTQVEMNEMQRKWMLERARGLKNQEDQEKRINAIYDQRKKFFEEEERRQQNKGHGGSPGVLLLRGVRDIFEGRMAYGEMDIGRALFNMARAGGGAAAGAASGVGAAGAGAAAGAFSGIAIAGATGFALALGAVEVASFKAAEAVGEYSQKVHETAVVTGLTTREVQQMGYVAKVTGQDVSSLNRMTRGLTQAITDTGSQGQRARATLQGMGVDVIALQHGYLTTNDLLNQVGSALERQPNMWLRNKEAIDLFKRAGIDSLPMLTEMREALQRTEGVKFFSEEQIDKFRKIHAEIALAGTEWDQFMLRVKASLAKPFIFTLRMVKEAAEQAERKPGFGELPTKAQPPESSILTPEGRREWDAYFRKRMEEDLSAGEQRMQKLTLDQLRAGHPANIYQQSVDYLRGDTSGNLEAAEGKLQDLKKTYDEVRASGKQGLVPIDEIRQATAEYEKQKKIVEALRHDEQFRLANAESLARLQEQVAERLVNRFELPAEAQLRKQRETFASQAAALGIPAGARREAYVAAHIAPYEGPLQRLAGMERTEQTEKFQREMQQTQATIAREMGRARLAGVEAVNVRQLGVGGVTREDVERDITAQQQERRDIAMDTFKEDIAAIKAEKIEAGDLNSLAKQHNEIVAATGKLAVAQIQAEMAARKELNALDEKERDEERKHRETMSKIQLADQEESIKHDAQLAEKRAQLRFKGDNPAAGIVESYRIAVELSNRLFENEMTRIALFETGDKAREERAIALHNLHREDEHASEEAQFKLAEMQQQQLDHLKGTLQPLYHTLFTNPRQFGQQLRSTVTEAALKPLTSGLSEMTATALHPLIYGAGGTGGFAGSVRSMFGGLPLLPDRSMPVTIVKDLSSGGGIMPPGTNIFSTGSFFGGGGTVAGGGGGEYRETFGLAGRGGFGTQLRRYLVGGPPGAGDAGASGASQFTDSTWRMAAQATGMGKQYKSARDAPQFIQDVNARWLQRQQGQNIPTSLARPSRVVGAAGDTARSTAPYIEPVSSPIPDTLIGTGFGGFEGGPPLANLPMRGGGLSSEAITAATLAAALGGGGTTARPGGINIGGFKLPSLAGLKAGFWNENLYSAPGYARAASSLGGLGKVAGVLTSPAAAQLEISAGLPLATAGAFGNRRGTLGGTAELVGGGALTGAGIGTMILPGIGTAIGAGVGALVGLGIGVGEIIAGVESPQREAIRLAKQIYHINVNPTTADQIVGIANQSYGGRVSVAIRSPEVRHMLGLYAAGTGQGSIFQQSANEAHGASLVESGGRLQQQATYQYGQAFVQSSNLPVYGGVPAQTYPGGGGNMQLSLNIGGQDAARFMQGQVVSPDVIQSQYATAMHASSGRVSQALLMNAPGSIAS